MILLRCLLILHKRNSPGQIIRFLSVPSPRPCRMYFLETLGKHEECAWVQGSAIFPFEGGHQFENLPVLRRRGRQKEKDYKYTVSVRY